MVHPRPDARARGGGFGGARSGARHDGRRRRLGDDAADGDRSDDGRGLSVFDYDRDGALDILMRNYRQPAELLRNRGGSGHWIELRLVGTRSNRDAIGARIRLLTARGWQTRDVHEGAGYLSGQSLLQHFGLGPDTHADEVRIAWPSGAETRLLDVTADRRYEVVEGIETAALAR